MDTIPEVTFTTQEINHLYHTIIHLIQHRGQFELMDLATAAAILHKPDWLKALYDELEKQGVVIRLNDADFQQVIDETWQRYAQGTPQDAVSYILSTHQLG